MAQIDPDGGGLLGSQRVCDLMRVALFFAFLLFAWAALLQSNDPDPTRWIIAYGVPALLTLIAGFTRIPRVLSAATAAGYLFAAWRSLPADPRSLVMALDSVGMASLGVEEVRESLGLAIVALWMVALFVAAGAPGRD